MRKVGKESHNKGLRAIGNDSLPRGVLLHRSKHLLEFNHLRIPLGGSGGLQFQKPTKQRVSPLPSAMRNSPRSLRLPLCRWFSVPRMEPLRSPHKSDSMEGGSWVDRQPQMQESLRAQAGAMRGGTSHGTCGTLPPASARESEQAAFMCPLRNSAAVPGDLSATCPCTKKTPFAPPAATSVMLQTTVSTASERGSIKTGREGGTSL
jgi:hypothetical protein